MLTTVTLTVNQQMLQTLQRGLAAIKDAAALAEATINEQVMAQIEADRVANLPPAPVEAVPEAVDPAPTGGTAHTNGKEKPSKTAQSHN